MKKCDEDMKYRPINQAPPKFRPNLIAAIDVAIAVMVVVLAVSVMTLFSYD